MLVVVRLVQRRHLLGCCLRVYLACLGFHLQSRSGEGVVVAFVKGLVTFRVVVDRAWNSNLLVLFISTVDWNVVGSSYRSSFKFLLRHRLDPLFWQWSHSNIPRLTSFTSFTPFFPPKPLLIMMYSIHRMSNTAPHRPITIRDRPWITITTKFLIQIINTPGVRPDDLPTGTLSIGIGLLASAISSLQRINCWWLLIDNKVSSHAWDLWLAYGSVVWY